MVKLIKEVHFHYDDSCMQLNANLLHFTLKTHTNSENKID